jgi:hypothetical protein
MFLPHKQHKMLCFVVHRHIAQLDMMNKWIDRQRYRQRSTSSNLHSNNSNQQRRNNARLIQPKQCPKLQHSPSHTPLFHLSFRNPHNTSHHQPELKSHKPVEPPANIANPWFGSEVEVKNFRATLRAAVLHRPVFALNMSTTLLMIPLTAKQHQQAEAHRKTHNTPHHRPEYKASNLLRRLQISPILDSAVKSQQGVLEPR